MCDYVAVMYAGKLVERAPMRALFRQPKHPYTEALLRAVPRINTPTDRLWSIEGQPPDLADIPPGCPFSPRCPVAEERCRRDAPPEVQVGPKHYARCWLQEGL
jgi:oligopeptide/dipeptide ABC transporter ATP-binding protein